MKTKKNYPYLLALLILGTTSLNAQEKQPPLGLSVHQLSTSKWNTQDGIPYKQAPGINMGAISFEVLSTTEVAYLCNATNEVMIADAESGSVKTKFPVLFAPRDFAYDNGFFYVLNADQVAQYDKNGAFIKNIPFPSGQYTGTERLTRYNNATYLLLPSGNSLKIEEAGQLVEARVYEGWITSTGSFVTTKITGKHSYSFTVITADGKRFDKTFTTELPTAGVYVVGLTNNRVYLDIQAYITGSPISVQRNIIAYELTANGVGAITDNIRVPDCYYVLSNNDFHLSANGTLLNMVTAPSGLYVFSLTETNAKDAAAYPDYISAMKYHFNDHMINVDPKVNKN
jgi:hypothetical protein